MAYKFLKEGDHFGDIGLMYHCKRTASVLSRNYNTLSRLSYPKYKEIIKEYPNYDKLLKKQIFTYKDPKL